MVRLISNNTNPPEEEILQIADKFGAEVLLKQELGQSFLQAIFVERRIHPSSHPLSKRQSTYELNFTRSAPINNFYGQPMAVILVEELQHTYSLIHV